jgi:hypothetical protein
MFLLDAGGTVIDFGSIAFICQAAEAIPRNETALYSRARTACA